MVVKGLQQVYRRRDSGIGQRTAGEWSAWFPALLLWVVLQFATPHAVGQFDFEGEPTPEDASAPTPQTRSPQATDLTADELANRGLIAFRAGRYQEAIERFNTFIAVYGNSREASGALLRIRPLLALSHIHLKRFQNAREVIQTLLQRQDELNADVLQDMIFWLGVTELFTQDYEQARTTLGNFATRFPQSPKYSEAVVLAAKSYLLQPDFAGGARFAEQAKQRLSGSNRSELVMVELLCLLRMESPELEKARRVFLEESRDLEAVLQIVAFHTLGLEIGNLFLARKQYLPAISVLQRIWEQERLLMRQEALRKDIRQRLQAARMRNVDQFAIFKYTQLLTKLQREIENFSQIQDWDAAVQFRLAASYLQLERYRESALLLEKMLEHLPPGDLVETAGVNLVRAWMEIENWTDAAEAAEAFQAKFPDSAQLPLVMLMKGQALREDRQFEEAYQVFEMVLETYPESAQAPEAMFLKGFTCLFLEDYARAIQVFQDLPNRYPQSNVISAALYWRAEAHAMAKQYDPALDLLERYLRQYPEGTYESEAEFRRLYCLHAQNNYGRSISGFNRFVSRFPDSPRVAEAYLLQGDAYLAEGDVTAALLAYRAIPEEDVRFFEEGWFKVGKGLRQQERWEDHRRHMEEFPERQPASPRVAEAIYWVGWTHRQLDQPGAAREIYWQTLRELGNQRMAAAVPELLLGLLRVYGAEERLPQLRDELQQEVVQARERGQDVLQMRLLWGLGQVNQALGEPQQAWQHLADAADLADPQFTSSRLMTDFAEAFRAQGNTPQAEQFFLDARKWNPRAVERDRIFAGLAEIARERGDLEQAMRYFQRFQEEALGSIRTAQVLLTKAEVERELDRPGAAEETLKEILELNLASKQQKATALLELGRLLEAQDQPQEAFAYYQRVYVLYRRWPELVAPAYWRSGQILENLGKPAEALATYQEMLAMEDLQTFAQYDQARARVEELEEVAPAS